MYPINRKLSIRFGCMSDVSDPFIQIIHLKILKGSFVSIKRFGMRFLHPFQCFFRPKIRLMHDIAENLQAVDQQPMPTEQALTIAAFCARRHLNTPVNICLKLRTCFTWPVFQIGPNGLLQCFSNTATVRYNAPVKNLHKVLARIAAFKIFCGIYKYV